MGMLDKLFGKEKKKEESKMECRKPKFIRKERRSTPNGDSTYETYMGTDAESARTFLMTKRVDEKQYYIVVETPEGNWGMDVEGLYLEQLHSWQTNISSAECEGNVIPMSWSKFDLEMAAKGFNDNFIVKVQCGKCGHEWPDGVRYQEITVVRCPNCKILNKVDSSNIEVFLV